MRFFHVMVEKKIFLIQCGFTHCHWLPHTQLLGTLKSLVSTFLISWQAILGLFKVVSFSRLNKPGSLNFSAQHVLLPLTNLDLCLTCSDLSIFACSEGFKTGCGIPYMVPSLSRWACSCWYSPGCCWTSLLPGHAAGVSSACWLPRLPGFL